MKNAYDLAQSLLCFCFEQRRLADAMEAHDSHEIAEHHADEVVVTGAVDHCCNTSSEEKRGEYESAHGLNSLGFSSAMLNKGLQGDLAFGEIADCQHVFCRNTVVGHLCDATGRNAELLSEGFMPSCTSFEPLFEVHSLSLEHPKPRRQVFSKLSLFSLILTMDALTHHRKKRLEQLIAKEPYNGDRAVFLKAVELTKGRLSQILDSEEPFGELSAMKMAKKLGLDERYFESGAPGKPLVWPFTRLTVEQIQSLPMKVRDNLENSALDLVCTYSLHLVSVGNAADTRGKRSRKTVNVDLHSDGDKSAKRGPVKSGKGGAT